MTLAERLPIGLFLAAAVAYLATPYAISVANRMQFFDKPVGYKGHGAPTPYLGGAALMSGFVVAVLLAGDWGRTVPLVGGVVLLWLVGTIDDRRMVSPQIRVLVELALAIAVWASGLGWDLHLGSFVDLALTCVWVLGIVNAFNLFDNMDGAAGTIALVVCAGAGLIGVVHGDVWLAVGAASLGGACLGFLPRNLCRPARIFLGDGGSMPLGFAAAVLVIAAANTSRVPWQSLPVALLLVGVPVLDTTLVIVSRRRRGVSVLTGGRDHLTHRARRFLPSARAVALSLGGAQALVSLTAVFASQDGASFLVISVILYLLSAAFAIVMLETQTVEEFGEAQPRSGKLGGGLWQGDLSLASVCVILLGLGAGLSPFFFAYYDASVWVPIGLGLTLAGTIAIVARPTRFGGPAILALSGLLGLGLWSLSSSIWAESVESAVVGGNRWLVYGALLLLVFVLSRSERRLAMLLGAIALGVIAVALSVLARLLGDNPASLFLGGRLNSPLGYINGEGCLFVMGFWLCAAVLESRRALVAGSAAAMATLMACLAVLSQSRGTALAMLGSLVVVLLLAPGRTRRVYGLITVAIGVALAGPDLFRIYHDTQSRAITSDVYSAAGNATLLAAGAVGIGWGLLTALWERTRSTNASTPSLRMLGSGLLVVLSVLALAVAVASAHRIEHEVRDQWHAFTHLENPDAVSSTSASLGYSRLLSGAGNRYDYWRIALRVWKAHPLLGVGAGNYSRPYYEQRLTTEDIQQPHSVELQTLSELGLVGVLALLAFLGGIGWGAIRTARVARGSELVRALLVGGLGAFTAWLAQTSVDWMHLLPGLTAAALVCACALIKEARPRGTTAANAAGWSGSLPTVDTSNRRVAVKVGGAMLVATLVVAGASLSRQGLADFYRTRAQDELGTDPAAALSYANRSLQIDSDATETYYVKAAALARFDQARPAEAALGLALAREPHNFITWALLGDIQVREHRIEAAKRDYAYAHRLNPREFALAELAADPTSLPR